MKQMNMDVLREQPIAKLKISGKSGRVNATLEYDITEGKWLENLPSIGTEHPDFKGLYLTDIDANRVPGSVRKLLLSYESSLLESPLGGNKPRNTYALDVTLVEEPLLTHEAYKDLDDDERRALKALLQGHKKDEKGGSLESLVKSDEGKEAMGKIQKGVTSFLAPSIIWRETEHAKDLNNFKDIGKIDTPSGDTPSLGQERDWLFMGVNARQSEDGKSWEIERVWQASSPGGWDNDLYKTGA